MSNFFGSAKRFEPEKPIMREVIYEWLPLEFYNYKEIEDIKNKATKYDFDTYTLLEEIPPNTNYYN